jgi:hypothetical protein
MYTRRNRGGFALRPFLVAILVAGLWVSLTIHAWAAPPPQGETSSQEIQDPATCGACHQDVYAVWQSGAHAQAASSAGFRAAWTEVGQVEDCLTCHSTSLESDTGAVMVPNVACQACHRKIGDEKHPSATMTVEVTADLCGECHTDTFAEWQLSGHGRRGIECTSCHQSHSQTLRIQPPQELCHQCHGGRFEDMAHSSHAAADLTCNKCHMPPNPASELIGGMGGVSTHGHTFSVGSQTCAQCHVSQIHGQAAEMASDSRIALPAEALESQAVEAAQERARVLASENDSLTRQVERQQVLAYVGGAFALGIGIFVGLLTALVLMFVLQRRGAA